jgi:ribose transport system permease protein
MQTTGSSFRTAAPGPKAVLPWEATSVEMRSTSQGPRPWDVVRPRAMKTATEANGAQSDFRYRLLQLGLGILRLGPALILLFLFVGVSLAVANFFTTRNIGNVLSQTSVVSVLALGQLLVIITRGIDLSVSSTLALSSVIGAIVYTHVHSAPLVILAILGTGLAVGAVNGVVFVVGRVPHAFIVTLASFLAVKGIALLISDGTPILGMPGAVQTIGGGSISWFPYSFFVVVGLAVLVVVACSALVWGRWLYAVGGNPEAARRTGIPVRSVLISVYVLAGLAAGVAGLIEAGLTATGSATFGEDTQLDSIGAVIIGGAAFAGGRGTAGNALVGAFTIGVIRNALNLANVNAFYQLIVIGLVVILAVEADVLRGYLENRFRVVQAARSG